jgi:hypothetical protein
MQATATALGNIETQVKRIADHLTSTTLPPTKVVVVDGDTSGSQMRVGTGKAAVSVWDAATSSSLKVTSGVLQASVLNGYTNGGGPVRAVITSGEPSNPLDAAVSARILSTTSGGSTGGHVTVDNFPTTFPLPQDQIVIVSSAAADVKTISDAVNPPGLPASGAYFRTQIGYSDVQGAWQPAVQDGILQVGGTVRANQGSPGSQAWPTSANFPSTISVSGTVTANQGQAGSSRWLTDSAVSSTIPARVVPGSQDTGGAFFPYPTSNSGRLQVVGFGRHDQADQPVNVLVSGGLVNAQCGNVVAGAFQPYRSTLQANTNILITEPPRLDQQLGRRAPSISPGLLSGHPVTHRHSTGASFRRFGTITMVDMSRDNAIGYLRILAREPQRYFRGRQPGLFNQNASLRRATSNPSLDSDQHGRVPHGLSSLGTRSIRASGLDSPRSSEEGDNYPTFLGSDESVDSDGFIVAV